jgi:hypothetical protein
MTFIYLQCTIPRFIIIPSYLVSNTSIQLANYYKVDKDSKTFVDRELKKDAEEVAHAFDKQFKTTNEPGRSLHQQIPKEDFVKFIGENFFPIEEGAGVLEELVLHFFHL